MVPLKLNSMEIYCVVLNLNSRHICTQARIHCGRVQVPNIRDCDTWVACHASTVHTTDEVAKAVKKESSPPGCAVPSNGCYTVLKLKKLAGFGNISIAL